MNRCSASVAEVPRGSQLKALWLADLVRLDFPMHDYLHPAVLYGYHFANATILGVDRAKKRVETNVG